MQRSKMTQMVGFRVAITCTCTHKGLQSLNRCGPTVETLPNWSRPLVPFHQSWIYMVSKADQLTLPSGGSKHA